MASPEQESKGEKSEKEGTLVRGADGKLFVVREGEITEELKGEKEKKVKDALKKAEDDISIYFMPTHATGVHVKVPTILRLPE
jgi:hypothetical protein